MLLVRHKGDYGSTPYWTLPGGTTNEGEDIYSATRREILEETGINIEKFKSLAYCTQHINHKRDWQSSVFVFEIEVDQSQPIKLNDPDGDIQHANFFPEEEAMDLLNAGPFDVIKLPAVAYLSVTRQALTPVWVFNEYKDGTVQKLPNDLS